MSKTTACVFTVPKKYDGCYSDSYRSLYFRDSDRHKVSFICHHSCAGAVFLWLYPLLPWWSLQIWNPLVRANCPKSVCWHSVFPCVLLITKSCGFCEDISTEDITHRCIIAWADATTVTCLLWSKSKTKSLVSDYCLMFFPVSRSINAITYWIDSTACTSTNIRPCNLVHVDNRDVTKDLSLCTVPGMHHSQYKLKGKEAELFWLGINSCMHNASTVVHLKNVAGIKNGWTMSEAGSVLNKRVILMTWLWPCRIRAFFGDLENLVCSLHKWKSSHKLQHRSPSIIYWPKQNQVKILGHERLLYWHTATWHRIPSQTKLDILLLTLRHESLGHLSSPTMKGMKECNNPYKLPAVHFGKGMITKNNSNDMAVEPSLFHFTLSPW